MSLDDLSLRRRLLVGFVAVVGIVSLVGLIVGIQYLVTFNGALRLQERLTPAAELADNLLLAQASASGDLSDYVLTDRKRALNAHLDSVSDADALIRALEVTLAEDSVLIGQLAGVRAAQQVWINDDATPTLELMEAGNSRQAARATNRAKAWESYDSMIATTLDFRESIVDLRNQTRDRVDGFARQLGWWLLVLAAVSVGVAVTSLAALNSWILLPLRGIRRDLSRATDGDHTHPIATHGPPELRAVSGDAERLRRSLVQEIDEANAARAGLAQDAPLVAQLQRSLAPGGLPEFAGLDIAGTSAPAEGVLAGDWWDAITVSNARLAIVIADTSGHGTAATVTAMRVRDMLRSCLRSSMDPGDAVSFTASALEDDENFVTAFVAVIEVRDSGAMTLTFTNAGHLPPVVVTASKDTYLCSGTGPLLSSLGGSWTQESLPLGPGDCLLAFTDGLIERNGPEGSDLEPDDVSKIIRSLDAPVRSDASEILARVINQMRERSSAWQHDDVTAVALARPVMAI